TLTGLERDSIQSAEAFDRVLRGHADNPAFYLMQASFDLKRHRLAEAKAALEQLVFLRQDPKYQVLQADVDVQEGRYRQAEAAYRQLIERKPEWDLLARLAYLRWKQGDFDGADRLYAQTEDLISAKDMRAYAWVELQRGLMALSRGRNDAAWAHYQRADRAYSGYWLVHDYMAEWFGAQRNFDAAIEQYRKLAICSPRPEFYQALGDLYLYIGKPALAEPWHDRALAAYLASARRGETQYYHHLATFYADSRMDGPEAVKWAKKDSLLRSNVMTQDALAWALYRNGQYAEALEESKKATAGNWQDAHLYFHAAMIHMAAGQTQAGKAYLQKASAINASYGSFHVHR
ncbi:MAG: hypothetical protein LUQ57_03390, partial [Methylococcaceae bacterium]|nr:hypothetical protein [Methylococcaceae bacterium]